MFLSQKKIEQEVKQLQAGLGASIVHCEHPHRGWAAKHNKQAAQWITLVDNLSQALKARGRGPLLPAHAPQEIGDVENWAEKIEADMVAVTSVLEYVHNRQSRRIPTCTHAAAEKWQPPAAE